MSHPYRTPRKLGGAAAIAVAAALLWPVTAPAAGVVESPLLPPAQDSYTALVEAVAHGSIRSATIEDGAHVALVTYRDGRTAAVRYPASDDTLPLRMAEHGVDVSVSPGGGGAHAPATLLIFVGGLLLTIALFVRAAHRRKSAGSEESSPSSKVEGLRAEVKVVRAPVDRFADVAGCDEAVEELAEIVSFLQTPEKFEKVNARMPAGLLLSGPPGTGKTLLARALAGEAGVGFFSASGSGFVEKYVGVGARRMRDLFKRALAAAPCVIFLDEIDAVGRRRSEHDGNSEREQTLNELLVQMDGFSSSAHVIVVAATNRPDVLDPALLRPGRFSRQVSVGAPSEDGRRKILGVHIAGKPVGFDVDLSAIACYTGGFSGAQLAELVNEAAIMAARDDRDSICQDDLREGMRRVLAGPKRKSAPIAEGELEKIACHEAGHVICAELCPNHENAQHVTIDPRGQAMGFAVFGHEDRALHDQSHLHEAMIAALGGRAAEQIVFGRVSTGAKNDLEHVNAIARAAVTEYGMSPRVGQFVADERFTSNETKAVIEGEIERMVADAYGDALELLQTHRAELEALTSRLMTARELERVDIVATLGDLPRWRTERAHRGPQGTPALARS
jgi:cell division protease FtsH